MLYDVQHLFFYKKICSANKGSTDKFGTTILTYLFCPHFGGKSSTEHHSASGFPPRSDEKIYANLADLILSVIPQFFTKMRSKILDRTLFLCYLIYEQKF